MVEREKVEEGAVSYSVAATVRREASIAGKKFELVLYFFWKLKKMKLTITISFYSSGSNETMQIAECSSINGINFVMELKNFVS